MNPRKPSVNIFLSVVFVAAISPRVQGQEMLLDFRPGARAIGLGGSLIAHPDDATAVFWNPATLPSIKEIKLTLDSQHPYTFSFGGVSVFFPNQSAIGFALARTGPGSSGYQIGSGAWGLQISRELSFGANVNIITLAGESWPTAGAGILFRPKSPSAIVQKKQSWLTRLLNSPILADRSGFAVAVHNVPLVLSDIDHEFCFGGYYQFHDRFPIFNIGYNLHRGEDTAHLGMEWPIIKAARLFTGIENFDSHTLALGLGLAWKNLACNVVYSSSRERILVSVSAGLGDSPTTRAQNYYERGIHAVRQGDIRSGLKNLENAAAYGMSNGKIQPLLEELETRVAREDAQIDSLMQLARGFQQKGWYINATLNYLKVLRIYPNHKEATRNIEAIRPEAKTYTEQLFRGGVENFDRNELEKAKEIFQTILLVQPDHAGAKAYLDRISSMYAEKAQEHYLQGLSHYGNGRPHQARGEFEKALSYAPDHSEAKRFLEEVNGEVDKIEQHASSVLSEAIRAERRGDHVRALLKYEQVQKLDPENSSAKSGIRRLKPIVDSYVRTRLARASSLYQNGNYQEARRLLNQVLQASPGHPEATMFLNRIDAAVDRNAQEHYRLALKSSEDRNWTNALSELEKTLDQKPGHAGASRMKRQVMNKIEAEKLLRQGKQAYYRQEFLQAMQLYNQVLEIDPDDSEARRGLELCQNKLNEQVEEFFNKGMAFYSEEDYRAALEQWNKVLKIDPNHPGAREYKNKAEEQLRALDVIPAPE